MLTLAPIGPDSWREPLSVREDQRRYIDGDEAARRLCEKCGFAPTGERDEDEIVMRLTL